MTIVERAPKFSVMGSTTSKTNMILLGRSTARSVERPPMYSIRVAELSRYVHERDRLLMTRVHRFVARTNEYGKRLYNASQFAIGYGSYLYGQPRTDVWLRLGVSLRAVLIKQTFRGESTVISVARSTYERTVSSGRFGNR